MAVFCGIINCGNRSDRDKKSFFRLPSVIKNGDDFTKRLSEKRRNKWLLAISRTDFTDSKKKWLRVCEDHFISGKPAELYDVKNPDWVPSQKMRYHKNVFGTPIHHQKVRKRKLKHLKVEYANEDMEKDVNCETDEDVETDTSCDTVTTKTQSVGCQTDFTLRDLCNMEKAYMDTITELIGVKNKVSKLSVSEDTFKDDDEKTQYYTGLQNFTTLMLIFSLVQKDLPQSSGSHLSKFQQFILTLMRLKLNLDFTDLSYRFCIANSTASRAFTACMNIMYKKLEHFLAWPDRDELIKEVPDSFAEAFGRKVAIALNSFEVLIEKPSNLPPAAQIASNCKCHNTIKFLIGICPQRTIAFISSAWEGNTSDKEIVENCGILDQLLPDDIVICDKGFNTHNEVEFYCEVIKIPEKNPKGKKIFGREFSEKNDFHGIDFSKHMEKIIGKLKQFRILQRTMPLSTLSGSNEENPALIDQIVKVCCALINISSLIVPLD